MDRACGWVLGWVLRQVSVCEQPSSDSQSVPMPACLVPVWQNHWRWGSFFLQSGTFINHILTACRIEGLIYSNPQTTNKYAKLKISACYKKIFFVLIHQNKITCSASQKTFLFHWGHFNVPLIANKLFRYCFSKLAFRFDSFHYEKPNFHNPKSLVLPISCWVSFFTLWLYIMEVKYLVNIDFKCKFENTRKKKVVSKQVS